MALICKLFGHATLERVSGGAKYMRLTLGTVDGIGRQHADLWAVCPRCGQKYHAGMAHVSNLSAAQRGEGE